MPYLPWDRNLALRGVQWVVAELNQHLSGTEGLFFWGASVSVCGARDRAQGENTQGSAVYPDWEKPAGPLTPILVNMWLKGKGELGK